jgi:hypothetical protein
VLLRQFAELIARQDPGFLRIYRLGFELLSRPELIFVQEPSGIAVDDGRAVLVDAAAAPRGERKADTDLLAHTETAQF